MHATIGASTRAPRDAAAIRAFRIERARRESPRSLVVMSVAIFALTLANAVIGRISMGDVLVRVGICVILLTLAYAISRPTLSSDALPVLGGLGAISVIFEFQMAFIRHPTTIAFAYVFLVMLASAPLLLSPAVLGVVAALAIAGTVVMSVRTPLVLLPASRGDWFVAAIAAEAVGAVLLYLRLRSVDELGEMSRLAEVRANEDALTGLLNRRGMEDAMREALAGAKAVGSDVHVCFVDIDWLKTANDTYGHTFGDEVIVTVAGAVSSMASTDHVLARWGGDEFLAFGVGDPLSDTEVLRRIGDYIAASGIDLAKWPGTVSIGSASAPAADADLEQLIGVADKQMYERRRAARARRPVPPIGGSTAD